MDRLLANPVRNLDDMPEPIQRLELERMLQSPGWALFRAHAEKGIEARFEANARSEGSLERILTNRAINQAIDELLRWPEMRAAPNQKVPSI